MKYLLCFLLAFPLCAQIVSFQRLSPQVRKYLQLTDAQVKGIVLNSEEYDTLSLNKYLRIDQVQNEIAEETRKDPLDPAALGVRYAEIELIRRDLSDLAAATQRQNLALLTDEQRTKMKAIEEAMKLFPIGCEAASVYLMSNDRSCPRVILGQFAAAPPSSLPTIR